MRKLCGDVKIKEHEPKHDYTHGHRTYLGG